MLENWRFACPPPPPAYDEAPLLENAAHDADGEDDDRGEDSAGRVLEGQSDSSVAIGDREPSTSSQASGSRALDSSSITTSVALPPAPTPPADVPEHLLQPLVPPPSCSSSVAIVGEGSVVSNASLGCMNSPVDRA